MEISSQVKYGLRALIDLSVNQDNNPISIKEISKRQNISERYLEQVFSKLKKAGFVRSVRGPYGGYLLNRKPSDIKISEILEVLEGIIITDQLPQKIESEEEIYKIVAQEIWGKMENEIISLMKSITLNDLKNRFLEIKQENSDGYMYYI